MAPSFDCAVSSLLCAEEHSAIFDDIEFEDKWSHRNRTFAGEIGLPKQSDECLASMAEKEVEHLPDLDYLNRLKTGRFDLASRNEALDWILKVHAHFGFGPLCAYLSVNYLDRFLSTYELPKGKKWMMQLLAVSCLSLAAKMEETEVPISIDLQVGECKFVFEARTIQRMELLILSTLKWRMQAITPFSFIDQFMEKMNNGGGGEKTLCSSLIFKSTQLILSTIRGIDFLEFRPSEIAAAVAIVVVVGEIKALHSHQPISALIHHLHKERVMKCVELIYEMALIGEVNGSGQTVPQSPIGVLDAAAVCLSYRSGETAIANSSDNKRRRLNLEWEQV